MIAAGLFITIISGFLVMAYTIGGQLTRSQTWLVAPLFAVFASMAMYGAVAYGELSDRFYPARWRDPDRQPFSVITPHEPLNDTHFIILVGLVIIAGALLFLRDVRTKAATEDVSCTNLADEQEDTATQEPSPKEAVAETEKEEPCPDNIGLIQDQSDADSQTAAKAD